MIAAVSVFLLALIPRAAYLVWAAPPFLGEYWQVSTGLLQQSALAVDGVSTTRLEPLYPLFLAASRVVMSDRVVGVQALQIAVASLGAVCLFLAVEALAGSRSIAWTASALYAFDPLLVRHAADSSDSALVTVLLILFVWLVVRSRTLAGTSAAGAVLGLAILTRAMMLPLVLLGGLACGWRRGASHGLAVALAALALAAPMLVRNDRIRGTLLPARQGVNLFIANSPYTASLMPAYSPDVLQDYAYDVASRDLPGIDRDSIEFRDLADPELGHLAWAFMRAHPIATLELKAKNILYFFSPELIPSHLVRPDTSAILGPDGEVTVAAAPLRPLSERLLYGATSLFVLVAAAAGVYVRRNDLRQDVVLWSIVVTFVGVYTVYFPATRYTAPIRFILLFYAAAVIDRVRRRAAPAPA